MTSVSFGTFIYVILNLLFGASGLWAEKQLAKQREELSVNIASIQKINDELELEYNALLKDPEVIASHARKLGYVNEGEHIVKIEGLSFSEKIFVTGKPYSRGEIQFVSEWICKTLGVCVFLMSMIISILLKLKKSSANGKKLNLKNIIKEKTNVEGNKDFCSDDAVVNEVVSANI